MQPGERETGAHGFPAPAQKRKYPCSSSPSPGLGGGSPPRPVFYTHPALCPELRSMRLRGGADAGRTGRRRRSALRDFGIKVLHWVWPSPPNPDLWQSSGASVEDRAQPN